MEVTREDVFAPMVIHINNESDRDRIRAIIIAAGLEIKKHKSAKKLQGISVSTLKNDVAFLLDNVQ